MRLKVNGQPLDITIEDEKTVGDVLQAFESEAAKNEATTVSIALDGKEVAPADFEKLLTEPLSDATELDLNVVSKTEIVDALHVIEQDFTILNERLSDIPVLLQSGKDAAASAIIVELTSKYDYFCHVVTMSTLFPEVYGKIQVEGKPMGEVFKDLLPILADFEGAMRDKDTVTLGDIAEYEIKPRLQAISDVLAASAA